MVEMGGVSISLCPCPFLLGYTLLSKSTRSASPAVLDTLCCMVASLMIHLSCRLMDMIQKHPNLKDLKKSKSGDFGLYADLKEVRDRVGDLGHSCSLQTERQSFLPSMTRIKDLDKALGDSYQESADAQANGDEQMSLQVTSTILGASIVTIVSTGPLTFPLPRNSLSMSLPRPWPNPLRRDRSRLEID
jgi:hypothetical protein